MKNKIDERLQQLKASNKTGLMTHLIIGYPSLDATIEVAGAMERAGADFIEMQIPFADPLADGTTIQRACEAALHNGTVVADAFSIARRLSRKLHIPLLFMAYFNTVYKYGVERFCANAQAAGIAGIVVPDAPLEAAEHEGLMQSCAKHNLYNILTLSPASTDDRIIKNAEHAQGFVYCMARQGITGAAQQLDPHIQRYLKNVRQHMQVPVAVGFGISNHERFKTIQPHCDIAVVGSAIIDVMNRAQPQAMAANVEAFIQSLTKQ